MATKTQAQIEADVAAGTATVLRQGMLVKMGEKVKNWKRRHCVLVQNTGDMRCQLYYYEGTKKSAKPKGTVLLDSGGSCSRVTIEEKPHPVMQIVTKERIWFMYPEESDDLDAWVSLIASTINSLPDEDAPMCEKCATSVAVSAVKDADGDGDGDGGKLLQVCKSCATALLAKRKQSSAAADKKEKCSICQFAFKNSAMLEAHVADWHTCVRCKKVCETDGVDMGNDVVRACEPCAAWIEEEGEGGIEQFTAKANGGGAAAAAASDDAPAVDAGGGGGKSAKKKKGSSGGGGGGKKKGKKKDKSG